MCSLNKGSRSIPSRGVSRILLILSSLLTFLHRLEDVPGSWPITQLVKSRGREPWFLTPSRKRVDHRPISISPPRGRVPATVPSEAGRKKPGGRRRLSSPQERASFEDATRADGRRHRCSRPGPRGVPRLRVPATARRGRGPAGRAGPSAHGFALSGPWSPSPNYGAAV